MTTRLFCMTVPYTGLSRERVLCPADQGVVPRRVRRREEQRDSTPDQASCPTAAPHRGAERGPERTVQGATVVGTASTAPAVTALRVECPSAACSPAYPTSIGVRNRGRSRQRSTGGAATAGAGSSTVETSTTRLPDAAAPTGMNKASKNQGLTRHLLPPPAELGRRGPVRCSGPLEPCETGGSVPTAGRALGLSGPLL